MPCLNKYGSFFRIYRVGYMYMKIHANKQKYKLCFVLWLSRCIYRGLTTRCHQCAVLLFFLFYFVVFDPKWLFHLSVTYQAPVQLCFRFGVLTKCAIQESWKCQGVFSSCAKVYQRHLIGHDHGIHKHFEHLYIQNTVHGQAMLTLFRNCI